MTKKKEGCCKKSKIIKEKEQRRNKVRKLLLNAAYPTEQEFIDAVESFANSNMTLEQIDSIAKTLTPTAIMEARKAHYGPKTGGGIY